MTDKDLHLIAKLMQTTFALRRKEVINDNLPLGDIQERWPALKIVTGDNIFLSIFVILLCGCDKLDSLTQIYINLGMSFHICADLCRVSQNNKHQPEEPLLCRVGSTCPPSSELVQEVSCTHRESSRSSGSALQHL